MEARESNERLVVTTGHFFEVIMANCHHLGIAGRRAGKSSYIQRAFRRLRKNYGKKLQQDDLCIESVTLRCSSVLWCHHIRVPAFDSSILVCRGPKQEFVALVGAQVNALDFEINSGLVKGGSRHTFPSIVYPWRPDGVKRRRHDLSSVFLTFDVPDATCKGL